MTIVKRSGRALGLLLMAMFKGMVVVCVMVGAILAFLSHFVPKD